MKKVFIIALTLLLIMSSSLWNSGLFGFNTTQREKFMAPEINLQTDIKRLKMLQMKFNNSDNPTDRYDYSAAIIDYLERVVIKMRDINEVYYNPAILILTGEIPNIKISDKNKR